MVLVAAAGPAMNIGLAIIAALSFHSSAICHSTLLYGRPESQNALVINVSGRFQYVSLPRLMVGVSQ